MLPRIMYLGESRKKSKLPLVLVVVSLLLLAFFGVGVVSLRAGDPPSIDISSNLPAIGNETEISITVREPTRGVVAVRAYFVQNEREIQLMEKQGTVIAAHEIWKTSDEVVSLNVTVGRKTIPTIKEGTGSIVVYAQPAGTWLNQPAAATKVLTLPIRLRPPEISVLSRDHFVTQGGSGAVRYRVGSSAVRHGVQAGKWWFPGYKLPGSDKDEAFAFFAVPYNFEKGEEVRIVATDDVGNESRQEFLDNLKIKVSKKDEIKVSDRFMSLVVPKIKAEVPDVPSSGKLVDEYVWINRELRTKNDDTLVALAKTSTPSFQWNRKFIQMPAKVFASFADHRTYMYEGQEIDQQYHLGYDLASTKRAMIPAANSGIVALAEYLGIYGKTVVIDHGFGIMTLYGHMSDLKVKKGQFVKIGEDIGSTGATGLALGDHLHFSVLVHGLPVRPLEWWDGQWIQNRIGSVLNPELGYENSKSN